LSAYLKDFISLLSGMIFAMQKKEKFRRYEMCIAQVEPVPSEWDKKYVVAMQLKTLLFVIGYKHSAPNGAKNSKFIGYAILDRSVMILLTT
jgi:hypothetical protein